MNFKFRTSEHLGQYLAMSPSCCTCHCAFGLNIFHCNCFCIYACDELNKLNHISMKVIFSLFPLFSVNSLFVPRITVRIFFSFFVWL